MLLSLIIYSQGHNIIWQQSFGGSLFDVSYSSCLTSDTGYIIAGETHSIDGDVIGNHGESDYWIIKLDALGTLQWQKCLGGSSDDYLKSIQNTSDGGYIVAGSSNSNNGDVSGNHGSHDFWIVKLNDTGNLQWQKSLGGSDFEMAYSVQQTTDGGYIIAGSSNSNDGDVSGNHGSNDFWIVKLDNTGNLQWQKCFGGSEIDIPFSIAQSADGGYIVAGLSGSNDGDVSGNHGGYDYWIIELDSYGNLEWQECYGGSGEDQAYCLQQTADGGNIVAGTSGSNDGNVSGNHGGCDYWVIKLDSSRNLEWQQSYGGSDNELAYSIQQSLNEKYIIAGWSNSNNGDVTGNHGYFDFWVVAIADTLGIGIEEYNNNITIYPNPFKDNGLNIKTNNTFTIPIQLHIIDIFGRTILRTELHQNNSYIKLDNISDGLYFIQLIDNLKIIHQQKVIKSKS